MFLAGEVFRYETHERYFHEEIAPRLDGRRYRFIGRAGFERKRKWFPVALLLFILSAVPATAAQVVTISGTGASLMSIRLLADAFMKANPKVRVEVLPLAIGRGEGQELFVRAPPVNAVGRRI